MHIANVLKIDKKSAVEGFTGARTTAVCYVVCEVSRRSITERRADISRPPRTIVTSRGQRHIIIIAPLCLTV